MPLPTVDAPPCDPLRILDQYLLAAAAATEKSNNNTNDVLRTADYLFGSTLDGALAVLEQNSTNSDNHTSHNVTCLKSKLRSLFLVKGSTKASGRGYNTADTTYMCILPDTTPTFNDTDDAQQEEEPPAIYYCSCRSFLEKSARSSNNGTPICKHLLALKLMSVLGMTCSEIQFDNEEELSRAVLQRMSLGN